MGQCEQDKKRHGLKTVGTSSRHCRRTFQVFWCSYNSYKSRGANEPDLAYSAGPPALLCWREFARGNRQRFLHPRKQNSLLSFRMKTEIKGATPIPLTLVELIQGWSVEQEIEFVLLRETDYSPGYLPALVSTDRFHTKEAGNSADHDWIPNPATC